MSPDDWQRVQTLFHRALEHPADERDAFLRSACSDPDLRDEVQALLDADAAAAERLESPAWRTPDSTVPPGTTIGPYRIEREAGRGGMGRVFVAERTDVGNRVALKLVRGALAAPNHVERFLAERRILAKLEHPNIARLLDAGVAPDDSPFFAMEYVEGEEITAYCDRRQLSVRERLDVFATVGQAVAYAHRNLVVHRDLKPSNVFVSDEGDVKLLDFGIAKILDPDAPGLTQTGGRLLTPGYAAPEQIRGDDITTATDVYALGVVLYELLVGRHPHRDATTADAADVGSAFETERRVLEVDPRRPSDTVGDTVGDTVSSAGAMDEAGTMEVATTRNTTIDRLRRTLRGDLDTIVLKALRRDPERRYESAAQLVDDIQRYLDRRPVSARPDTVAYRVRRFVQRHRWGVAAATAVLLSLVLGLGVAIWQGQVARDAREQAEQELAKSEAVTGFLVDLFQANDPAENPGLDVTARTLLERGRARIDTLQGQPLVQAELQASIGRVYRTLGRYAEADTLLTRSLGTRRAAAGCAGSVERCTEEVGLGLQELGILRWRQSKFAEAETVLRESVEILREIHGTDAHPDVAASLNALGLAISKQGRLAEAVPIQKQLAEIYRETSGEDSIDLAVALNNLAVLYQNLGRYAEAIPLARETLEIQQQAFDPPHPYIAYGLTNLGAILTDALRAEEAIPYLQRAMEMRAEIYDPGHPERAVSVHNLAEATFRSGRLHAADSLFRVAREKTQSAVGTDHAAYADLMHDHGLLRRAQGDAQGARSALTEALAVREQILGPDALRTARTLTALARLDLDAASADAASADAASAMALRNADARLRRALQIVEEQFEAPHPLQAIIQSRLGRVLLRMERAEEAEPILRASYDRLVRAGGVPVLDARPTATALARLYEAQGQTEYADTWRRRAQTGSSGPPAAAPDASS